MRRFRPPKFFNLRIKLVAISIPLAFVVGLVPADGREPDLSSSAAAQDWELAGFEGLDNSIRDLVKPPTPARLDRDTAIDVPPPQSRPAPSHESSQGIIDDVFADVVLSDVAANPVKSAAAPTGNERPVPGIEPNASSSANAGKRKATQNRGTAELRKVVVEGRRGVVPPRVVALRRPIENCLRAHVNRRLSSGRDSCWSMMHAFLGWGPACEIHVGGPRGPRSNAIQWVAQNESCGGRRLFYLDGNRIRGREGPGYQGHPAQFLAMLAQCGITADFPMRVNGRQFTVADLIREEQKTCRAERELTFTLIGLVHYLGTEAKWSSDVGESWDMSKVLALELAQPVNGTACGGTHRIMAISYAVAKRRSEGGPSDGQWWRADKYIRDYHLYAMNLQNRDGSFSSDWFRQRSDWGDMDRRVQTTGHILEWLVFSLPDEALYDTRIVSSVRYLTRTMSQNQSHDWRVGPKGHAIRALRLYHERMFGEGEPQVAPLAHRGRAAAQGH